MYNSFKKYEVKAENLRDFCDRYHNYPYTETDFLSHKEDLAKDGYTFISHHDSITGNIVSYYGGTQ